MSKLKPLCDDWLSWNPETIHHYPGGTEREDPDGESTPPARHPRTLIVRALLRDLAAGVVSGVVAAVLLMLLIAFFPGSARADATSAAVVEAPRASLVELAPMLHG